MFASMNLFEIISHKIVCPVQEREVKEKIHPRLQLEVVAIKLNKKVLDYSSTQERKLYGTTNIFK